MTEREKTIERIETILNLTNKESINVNIPRLAAERAVSMLKDLEAKPPIHVHEEYPEHDWKLNKDGNPDEFTWDCGFHNGPSCKRCHYSFCIHCKPYGWNDEPCIIDYYKCPGCGKTMSEKTAFCSNCGQEMKWNA